MGCLSSTPAKGPSNVSGRPPSTASEKTRKLLHTNSLVFDEEALAAAKKGARKSHKDSPESPRAPSNAPPTAPPLDDDPDGLLMGPDPDYELGMPIEYAPAMRKSMELALQQRRRGSRAPADSDSDAGAAQSGSLEMEPGRKLLFGYRTIAGRAAMPPSKPNQDSVVAFRLTGRPNVAVFGVFDGHGPYGEHASHYCRMELHRTMNHLYSELGPDARPEEVLERSIDSIHRSFVDSNPDFTGVDPHVSGTTLIVAMIVDGTIWVANVGDSRCILGEKAPGDARGRLKEMSDDHKPERDSERERIERTEAVLMTEGQLRGGNRREGKTYICRRINGDVVYGVLFTRSVGDADAHIHLGVSADPEFKRAAVRDDMTQYLVLASDGVWDMMSNEQVLSKTFQARDPLAASEQIAYIAKDAWDNDRMHSRRDDITVCVVQLGP